MSTAPARAVIQPDPAKSLLQATSLTLPSPGVDDYLIAMRGTAPCLGELTWESAYPEMFSKRIHRVPGTEGAGVVLATPANGQFKVGDAVMFRLDAWLSGTLRDYTLVPAANVARKPTSLSWTEASATPLSSLTAWQGLFEHGVLDASSIGEAKDKGKKVLVTGASGSVGMWALRFGHAAGATMVALGSGAKAADMKAAGAAEVIDYRTQSVDDWAKNNSVDQVLDCTGKDTAKVWSALKDGGRFLSMCTDPSQSKPEGKTAEVAKWYLVQPRGSDLARIADLIDANGWRPIIDSVVPFESFQAAYDKVDGGKAAGKVVITVSDE
ncbi:hypothetical protein CcaverHIS002_0210060 [Cutaneotrichosporon cavernicola]|uniref:Enoyl reductase (ER) domain-containing protein n=1 Tax=Cutaneotrichosporon cavernicola TaxID=279322 RepID=A0AA48L0B0_9TREE|nr:uncharacterized protein CcaverHIS019_0210080 [Cutaneotrichosporon cavernicola]BEI81846.1 hypothetical protein CcaverHIS002_0210060 [Cutaneotrichosporon cavernicola]BEI89646.1 hypothetical protein CcaverHIS019_0210080 [Cutaneotrichosporon cavernicola]BEI97417.1 hypothetical protein CcaverHIS631_0210060 [Cutaneotrichosporon cavernicola]BEJ05195.1 hypothetical protein CcaverHIS641_0210120 [Cutaneotrichosporon cavernicola]